MAKIKLDDADFDLDQMTVSAKNMILELQKIEDRLTERTNMIALLTKAKRAYIADLKQEMIASKAGLDLFE